MNGIVKWFNKTKKFGFILLEDNTEIFVHFSDIIRNNKILEKDMKVKFDIGNNKKGNKAINVTIIE